MVVQYGGPGLAEEGDAPHHLVPVLRMQLDDPPFLGGERPVLAQQPGGHAEFADVVQDPGEPQHLHALGVQAQFAGDQHRGVADALAVSAGVAVLDVDGLHQRPDGRLVGRPLPVVLREHPPGDAHRQQHEQRGDRAVRAAPQDGHHQSGEAVHGGRGERAGEQPAPGPADGHPLGEGEDAAVEEGEHPAERQDRGPGGQQRVGEVRGDDRVPAVQRPVHPGGGPDGERELRGPPDPAQRRALGEQRARYRDQRRGGRGQQEGTGQQDRVEGAGETPAGDLLAAGVQRGQEGEGPPGRTGGRQRQQTEQGTEGDAGHVHTRPRGSPLHVPLP